MQNRNEFWRSSNAEMEKNGVMVFKMLETTPFFVNRKKSVTVWAKYFITFFKMFQHMSFYLALLQNTMDYWFLSYH